MPIEKGLIKDPIKFELKEFVKFKCVNCQRNDLQFLAPSDHMTRCTWCGRMTPTKYRQEANKCQ